MNEDSTSKKKDPRELIARAKDGDRDAFGELYAEYFTPIWRYIFYRVRSREETEDIVQNVFIKAFVSVSRFEQQKVDPLAYFYTIARNTLIDYWRKKKDVPIEHAALIRDNDADPHELVMQMENRTLAQKAIAKLEGDQREVIVLRFINDLSVRETAHIMGKSEAAVRQMQLRAIKAMREHFT
ncbi:MAG: sigma-70 family RNA polymerase sigma factor [Candidatus Ryanbacteria bacterium]|nr:sigma-70 family RNA polymerase sigma factor [Candidatus Ryanbacteria bacterium]